MSSHMIDSILFSHVVSTEEMKEVFNEKNNVQKLLDVEAALARAEAELGVIPKEAADEICSKAKVENIQFDKVREGILKVGHTLVPLLKVLESVCEGDAGQYIHWGATTQDIRDTAMMLQVKEGREIILNQLLELEQILADTAQKYKNTVMVGRTHGQHALPITFGYKVAVWVDEIQRHIQRFEESKDRLLVGNLSGAVGTFASFGEKGPEIERLVMKDLGLGVPNICWHASRDRFAEFLNNLALVASTCGKIANEIFNLQSTELDEVEEGFVMGKVGSSTMPHKRNPGTCECIVSLAKLVRNNANLMLQVMEQEHERDGSLWRTEWILIPESCIYTSCILKLCIKLMSTLNVKEQNMLKNLDILQGLLLSERVMFAISDKVGKQRAHEIIYEASMKSFEEKRSFGEVLMEDPRVKGILTTEEIERLLDPKEYIGLSAQIVDKVISVRGSR
ncbi:MAG: adenylosuccinate lyase [Clostridia bacterium]|nr:adenylosuccinate lyase [Clostridia bacterium]